MIFSLLKNPLKKSLIISIVIFSALFSSCNPSIEGLYSTTLPNGAGEGRDGYPVISLKSDHSVEWVVRYSGDYTVGKWTEEDGKIIITGLKHHDIDGTYKWNVHPNAQGIGNSGMVLSQRKSYPMGRVLFPVDGVE